MAYVAQILAAARHVPASGPGSESPPVSMNNLTVDRRFSLNSDSRAVNKNETDAAVGSARRWDHIRLADGVELQLREPLSKERRITLDQLIGYARTLFPGDDE